MRRPPARPSLTGVSSPATEESFRRLVERQGPVVESHCRRMLGTPHDAEDAVQETLLRAWRGLPGYEGRSSLHTWIHRIATNVCIDVIAERPKHAVPIDHGPAADHNPSPEIADDAAEPAALYEQREALEQAFTAALEHLPPRQRTVLILRDGLGFSAKEVAPILQTTVAATNSVLQRARAAFGRSLPMEGEQALLRSLEDARTRELVARLVDAFEAGDIGAILAIAAHE
jgi:RNA polymerase sigma-70 factor (ECF subfamily)